MKMRLLNTFSSKVPKLLQQQRLLFPILSSTKHHHQPHLPTTSSPLTSSIYPTHTYGGSCSSFSSKAAAAAARAAAVGVAASPRRSVATFLGISDLPPIKNEAFAHYAPGSHERIQLEKEVSAQLRECPEIPCVVNGREVKSSGNQPVAQKMPSRHAHKVCVYHEFTADMVPEAIEGAMEAKKKWMELPFDDRMAVFLKAADLLATKYRQKLNAAVMLGQGKNPWQAEIDAAVETIDFWRFGVKFAKQLYHVQPPEHSPGVWNRMEARPLEGFVAAITPFNFIAIAANLPSSPALMGNCVLWKPAENTVRASYILYEILKEAGLPEGLIQFMPGDGPLFSEQVLKSKHLAGVHFTGSTAVFNQIYRQVATNLDLYRSYPRICGETGGKNFHMVHASADVENVVHCTVRGAFEYQGQKCSATSRMYLPKSLAPTIIQRLVEEVRQIKMGGVEDLTVFMSAVINRKAYDRITGYIERAKASPKCTIVVGGEADDAVGYFIQPTIIVTSDPHYETMAEEIFGPVLTIYVYEDAQYEEVLQLCDQTSPYALTGAVFASDRTIIAKTLEALRDSTGNFYINDKSTGSIVGQQPFGGARRSGTNDKSGSAANLSRWMSSRSIKETFVPISNWTYPSNKSE